jgi:hypothetical protein
LSCSAAPPTEIHPPQEKGNDVRDLDQICTILYRAFIEIRVDAYEKNNNVAFWLADLLHNIPCAIKTEAAAGGDFSRVLGELHRRAEERGLTSWVDNALSNGR